MKRGSTPDSTARRLALRLVVLVLLATLVLGVHGRQASSPAGELGSVSTVFTARWMIGLQRFADALDPSRRTELYEDFERLAIAGDDGFAAAAVARELLGADEATARIDTLLAAHRWSPSERTELELLASVYGRGVALDRGVAARLREAHGWFGDLAVSQAGPEGDPLRVAVVRSARFAIVGLTLISAAFCVFAVGGCVLATLAAIGRARRRLPFAYRSEPADGPEHHLALFALLLAGLVAILLVPLVIPDIALPVGTAQLVLLALLLVPGRLGVPFQRLRSGLGWERGHGFWRETAAGVVGYLACAPMVLAGFAITLFLTGASPEKVSHPIVEQLGGQLDPLTVLWLYATACVLAPLAEEIMFRGALYHHLRRSYSVVVAALVSGFFFAAIHPQGFAAIPALTAVGTAFALIREWRASLLAPVAAHAINNFVVVTAMLLMFS